MSWHAITEEPIPLTKEIIWTNGKEMCLGRIYRHERDGRVWHEEIASGVSGWEVDIDIPHYAITHWMEAPSVPSGG